MNVSGAHTKKGSTMPDIAHDRESLERPDDVLRVELACGCLVDIERTAVDVEGRLRVHDKLHAAGKWRELFCWRPTTTPPPPGWRG